MREPEPELPQNTTAGEDQPQRPPLTDREDKDPGSVSVGDIGEGSQVAIGESITQIGTQVVNVFKANLRPVIFMLFLVLTGIGAILFTLLRPEEQEPMHGLFNIAVAAFDERKDGRTSASAEGERIAILLAEELDRHLPDREFLVWGPMDREMRVSGIESDERFAQALKLSDEIRADVIIYGLIDESNSLTIEPEILIDLESFILGEELLGQELDGAYALGPEIFLPGDLDGPGSRGVLLERLTERATPVSHFAFGLDFYRVNEFEKALTNFHLAEEAAQDWEGPEGKGVIYLFLGAAEMNLGTETDEQARYETAHDWFDRTASEDETYARGYLGHGFTFLQEANQLLSAEEIVDSEIMSRLESAEEAFENGLSAPVKPPNSDVEAKARFGLGRVYFLSSLYGDEERFDDSRQEFNFVIDQFHDGNERLQELAARSYGWLGLLNYRQINDGQAIKAYQCALEYGRYESLRQAWTEKLDELCLENSCEAEPVEGMCDGLES